MARVAFPIQNGAYVVSGGARQHVAETVIDDFESGDLADYTADDDTQWTIVDTTVHGGTWALRVDAGNGGTDHLHSNTGLNYYPSRGDTFRIWIWKDYSGTGTISRFQFAEQATEGNWSLWGDGYMVEWSSNAEVIMQKNTGGNFGTISDSTAQEVHPDSATEGWWYTDVLFDPDNNGDITAEAYTSDGTLQGSATINDTDFDGGGILWVAPSGTEADVFFDDLVVP